MQYSVIVSNVAWMLVYMLVGFGLVKVHKADSAHARSISSILVYVCGSAMIFEAFQRMEYNPDDLRRIGLFYIVTLIIQILMIGVLFLILRRRYAQAKYRILTVAAVLGNVGFLGLPMVRSLFPNEPIVACYSSAFSMDMNLIVFTVGVYMLTHNARYISLRAAVVNPTTLTILVALPLYLLNYHLPEKILEPITLLGRMTTPLCMMVLGMRLAATELKTIFNKPFVYAGCFLKLIVYPLFAYACVYFIPGLDATFKACVLVLCAMPSASIMLSMAEIHQCEQENSAKILLASTLLCTVTVPLILLIL